jgi:2-oxoglutarate dehydrogenase E1 component
MEPQGRPTPEAYRKLVIMSEGAVASRGNLDAIEDAYRRWRQDPASVDESWRYFFEGFELGSVRPAPTGVDQSRLQSGVIRLIYAYRDLGHFLAHLDPLNDPRPNYPLLELSEFGLSEADMDRVFDTSPFYGLPRASLRDLLKALQDTYCRTIGVEYMHIQDTRIRRWLQERMEPRRNRPSFDHAQKLRILKSLHYAELFEHFLQTRFTGQKRFSLEGSETLVPVLEAIVEKAPDYLIREIIIGMSHRGRLNVLANILRKPYEEIFAQFEENYLPESMDGDGDVKYHLGFSSDRVNSRGLQLHLSLAPNPSHLEAVDPVVEGRTRAKQTAFGDVGRKKGVPVLIHGDAAFAGQGLVAETLNLSQLEGYTTGGTIHIIVNNQIGFTTSPADARSTMYCSDVGKMIQAPVFHVNGEDVEASVYVAELALEFRQQFGCDILIDMYCFRRMGHNEGDDPSYTQPVMYDKIKKQPKLTSVYQDRLIITGDLTADEAEAIDQKFENKLDESLHEVKKGPHEYATMHGFDGRWQGMTPEYSHAPVETGVPEETLRFISAGLIHVPDDFTLHPKLAPQLATRNKDFVDRKPVDWAFAELLAFGSLLLEGTPVRLSGQDSRRGTFSQRHAVYFDYEMGYPYVALNHLRPDQAPIQVYDSLLSEAAVLGFEFGYALDAPDTLVMWEAQFGDFSNGAQVIIDQFVASSESKWQRDSGVVLLLPHGYEGAGPEHSSARLERFLQLCADDNMQVCMCSTPAQHFHMLRRQMKRNFRKPLIVMTPKSMLRAKISPVEDLISGRFHEILDDGTTTPDRIRRVVLCSGKVYHELAKLRTKTETDDVAIVRVEQFYPFPEEQLRRALGRYRKAEETLWVQEESQNMGGWSFMEPRLRELGYAPEYVGRDASASPATGSHEVHNREQAELVEAAIRGEAPHLVRASNPVRPRLVESASPNGARYEDQAVAPSKK